jgi:hypothetical protein
MLYAVFVIWKGVFRLIGKKQNKGKIQKLISQYEVKKIKIEFQIHYNNRAVEIAISKAFTDEEKYKHVETYIRNKDTLEELLIQTNKSLRDLSYTFSKLNGVDLDEFRERDFGIDGRNDYGREYEL